jgi:hypothetical protein
MGDRVHSRSPLMSARPKSSYAAEEEEVSVSVSDRGSDEPSGLPLHANVLASDDVDESDHVDGVDNEESKQSSHYSSTIGAFSPPPLTTPTPPALDPHAHGSLFTDEDDSHREEFLRVSRMTGYQFSWWLEIRYWIAVVCSGFILWLINLWVSKIAQHTDKYHLCQWNYYLTDSYCALCAYMLLSFLIG